MAEPGVSTRAITTADAASVGEFLHVHLNPRVSSAAWAELIVPPWKATGPNHGFQLVADDGRIVGAYVAVYSPREVGGSAIEICNLAAFCVLEDFRAHSLKLIRALLKQPGFVFTDLSPSGNVVAMNERLGFRRLDTATRLVLNTPHPGGGIRVTSDPAALEGTLSGRDAVVYRDHLTAGGVEHLLIERAARHAYLMYRRDRRKGLPLFATPIFVGGDRELVQDAWGAIRSHLLRRGLPFTLAERRVLGFARGLGTELAHPRPKMFRGEGFDADDVDYLYSELTLVAW